MVYFDGISSLLSNFSIHHEPENKALAFIAKHIYELGRIVAAVWHGPSRLLNIRLNNGEYLIKGKKVNGFSNAEEEAIVMEHVVPFLLEFHLIVCGELYEKSSVW